jgi:DNA polymerase-3 subunit beta
MKIVCKKNDILESINISLRAIPAKTTMPILGCIVIRANSNNIKFITNDMEMAIETIVKGRVIEDGSIAIDAKKFSDIVRKITDEEITIETNEYYMATIRYGNNEASFNCLSDEEFPDLPTVEKQNAIRISQFSLKEIILQTVFSISDNESQKIMTGELFEIEGDKLTVVALDGHRIAIRKITLNDEYKLTKVIIPGKTLLEITKILSGEVKDEINIYFTKNHVLFELENTIILSRLIDGEYYKINQMLSGDYDTKLKVNRRSFAESIDRSTLFIKETDKKPIILDIRDFTMNIKVNSQQGAINENLSVNKEGNDIMIGFNPKFLLDVIRVIDDEEITIYMTNAKAPCFIKNEDESYIYLILPINFNAAR